MSTLARLFPEGDYRFHLGLQRGEPVEFFASRDQTGALLAERRRWLAEAPQRYAGMLPGSEGAVAETLRLTPEWGLPPQSSLIALGGVLEPDLLLMVPDANGVMRLQAGVLCFPTSWALADKLGQTMEFIHGPVPGLNDTMGGQIAQFMGRLKPGAAYFRQNWGIAATAELNMHPAMQRPRPGLPLDPAALWLRVEHQALLALPSGRGLVFGIRIETIPLTTVRSDVGASAGLGRALLSMPDAMRIYKGIGEICLPLAQWLMQ